MACVPRDRKNEWHSPPPGRQCVTGGHEWRAEAVSGRPRFQGCSGRSQQQRQCPRSAVGERGPGPQRVCSCGTSPSGPTSQLRGTGAVSHLCGVGACEFGEMPSENCPLLREENSRGSPLQLPRAQNFLGQDLLPAGPGQGSEGFGPVAASPALGRVLANGAGPQARRARPTSMGVTGHTERAATVGAAPWSSTRARATQCTLHCKKKWTKRLWLLRRVSSDSR